MVNPEAGIRAAIQAIRKAAQSDLDASHAALLEIQHQTQLIEKLTRRTEVRREAEYLMSRALDRFAGRDNSSNLVEILRLHGAVARFQYALQQLGYLRTAGEQSQQITQSGQRSH